MLLHLLVVVWLIALLLYMLFDVNYFIRGCILTVTWRWRMRRRRRHLLDQVTLKGLCNTNDMDFAWRMNNARFLKDCDFGRYQLWVENGVWDLVRKLEGSMALGASCARYRRSIYLFEAYTISTKVLCWDKKAFYLEQRVERCRDGFLCAIVLAKQTLIGLTTDTLLSRYKDTLQSDLALESPLFPDDVSKWIESNQISSDKLKKA